MTWEKIFHFAEAGCRISIFLLFIGGVVAMSSKAPWSTRLRFGVGLPLAILAFFVVLTVIAGRRSEQGRKL